MFIEVASLLKFSANMMMFSSFVLSGLVLVMMVFIARKSGLLVAKQSFQKGDRKRILLGMFAIISISIVGQLLLTGIDGYHTTANEASLREMYRINAVSPLAFLVGIVAPIVEEILYRRIMPQLVFKGYEKWGYLVGGMIFILLHMS